MSKLLFILSTILLSHEVLSQSIRQPDLNRNLIESLINAVRQESRLQSIDPYSFPNPNSPVNIPDFTSIPNPITAIPDFPINIPNPIPAKSPFIPIPKPINVPNPINLGLAPSDPSICKNLANTIQLMVLSDLLKTRERDEIGLRLAGPALSDLLSTPVRAPIRSLANTISPTVISSNVPSIGSFPRIVVSNAPNVLSSISNGRIERGALTNMLKLLGSGL